MKDSRIIKGLNSQINKLKIDSDLLKTEISNKQKEYSQKLKQITDLENRISHLNKSGEIKELL